MKRITLTSGDFDVLRSVLPTIDFCPESDGPPDHPLLLRHLHDYRFPSQNTPKINFRLGGFESEDARICGYYWLPMEPKGTTFLVHGYFDHVGLYGHLVEHLLAQGQAVVAFDLPGHGLSTGQRLAIDSFEQYERVLRDVMMRCQHFPKPFNGVGQSTGGAILLHLLQSLTRQQAANPFAKITLLAPLIRPWRWSFSIWLYRLLSPFVRTTRRKFRHNSTDREFVKFLNYDEPLQVRRIPLVWIGAMKAWIADFALGPQCDWPLQVVQGGRDTTVDWRYNLSQIQEKFPNTEVKMVPEAMHHLVNERVELRNSVFENIHFG